MARDRKMSPVLAAADLAGDDRKSYLKGTHRIVAPAETLARVTPLLRDMGITRVANVTGLDRIGIPVVIVTRPNSRSIAVSQGKGVDLDSARASGVMEAVENYHAERIDHPLVLGSASDLSLDRALVDLEALPRLAGSGFHNDRQILWIEGEDLLAGRTRWVPYEMVHSNYTLPLPAGSGCFVASTNGLASGNHLIEAVNHGIGEVVERDSTSLWKQLDKPRRDATRIDLESIDDDSCRGLLGKLDAAGIEVAVWDTTSDVGIASFYCLILDRLSDVAHSGEGAGCHPARAVALSRSLTEAVQVRTTYITGSRDDLSPEEYENRGIAQKITRARHLMTGSGPLRDFRAVPSQDSANLAADLDWMLERLRAVGVRQVIALDLTKPKFGLPVARVVIPGLEGPDDHDFYVRGPRALAVAGAGS